MTTPRTRPTAMSLTEGLDLTGRTCVITGASSGLGRESARVLAAAGAHVILAARNTTALSKVHSRIAHEFPESQVSVVELNLSALISVRAAAEQIRQITPAIHILMNNAGVMFTPHVLTADGYENHFGTNHLGHFELTRMLEPCLVAAGGARVVNLSSDGHRLGELNWDDLHWQQRPYDKFEAYGASKTANALHAVELDKRLRDHGVNAFAVHPGMVATRLSRHMTPGDIAEVAELTKSSGDRDTSNAMRDSPVLTAEQGAATQVWAAVSAEVRCLGGRYLADCRASEAADYALNSENAARLWTLSQSLCA